jgi:hypothetical protein
LSSIPRRSRIEAFDHVEAELPEYLRNVGRVVRRIGERIGVPVFAVADDEGDAMAKRPNFGLQNRSVRSLRLDGSDLRLVGGCPNLLLDPCDALGGFLPAELLLARIEAERDAVIGERGGEVASVLVGLGTKTVGVEVLRGNADCRVELGNRRAVVALGEVVISERVMDAGVVRIELEAFVEVAAAKVHLSLAHIAAAAAGIGRDDFRIAAKGLVIVRDGEIDVATIASNPDGPPDIGLGEVGLAELFCGDQAGACCDAVLEAGRALAGRPVRTGGGEKLAFHPCDAVGGIPAPALLLVGIETQCVAEIGERVVEFALGFVDVSARADRVEVSRRQPDRFVYLGERAPMVALLEVIIGEDVANARMLRIEGKCLVQISQRTIDLALADISAGAAGIGARILRA